VHAWKCQNETPYYRQLIYTNKHGSWSSSHFGHIPNSRKAERMKKAPRFCVPFVRMVPYSNPSLAVTEPNVFLGEDNEKGCLYLRSWLKIRGHSIIGERGNRYWEQGFLSEW
jgi:hypothetical protein